MGSIEKVCNSLLLNFQSGLCFFQSILCDFGEIYQSNSFVVSFLKVY